MANEFKEVARITITDDTDLVLSQMINKKEVKGFTLNKYIRTEKYTGFAKGVYIPADDLVNVLAMFEASDLEAALEAKPK